MNHYYLGVGEGHDDERNDELHDGGNSSVDLPVVIRRPVDKFESARCIIVALGAIIMFGDCYLPAFFAVRDVRDDSNVYENAVGQRGAERHQPDDADGDPAGGHFHPRAERVQDDEEAVDGDGSQRQRRHVHRSPLCCKSFLHLNFTIYKSTWNSNASTFRL